MEKANQRKVAGRNYKELTDDELVVLARETMNLRQSIIRYNL